MSTRRKIKKKMKQNPAYEKETLEIRARKPQYENKVHRFVSAKWTHPNGHPRCKMCGQEESFSPECNREATKEEHDAVVASWGFDKVTKGFNVHWDGDGLQGVGQRRDSKGRWTALPGKSLFHALAVVSDSLGYHVVEPSGNGSGGNKKVKTYKTLKGAEDFVQREANKDEADTGAYRKYKSANRRLKKELTVARERHTERSAAQTERENRPVVAEAKGRALREKVAAPTKKPAKKTTKFEESEVERMPVPGTPGMQQMEKAKQWAKESLPDHEAKYSGLVARLLKNRGITQDPKKRGEIADRYGISPKRQAQIEGETYDVMFPNRRAPKPLARNLGNEVKGNVPDAQKKAMLDQGARRAVPVASPDNTKTPPRFFKATKGPNKGKFVEVSADGKSRTISDADAAKKTKASKVFWAKVNETDRVKSRELQRKRFEAGQAIIDDEKNTIAQQRAQKAIIAGKWAEEMGYDPTDTFWHGFFWKDPSLVKQQDGKGDKTVMHMFKTPLPQKESPSTPRRVVRRPRKPAGTAKPTPTPKTSEKPSAEKPAPTSSHPRRVPKVETTEPKQTRREVAAAAKRPKKIVVPKKKPTGEKKGRQPKREKLEFDSQTGLPLTDDKPTGKKYVPAKYKPTIRGRMRKATAADIKALEERGIKIPEKHKNIRVPEKESEGFGSVHYIYDDHQVKVEGKVVTDQPGYTQSHDIAGQERKFDRVVKFSEHIGELDAKIRKDHNKNDTAAGVALMRILAMRPSNAGGGETQVPTGVLDKNGKMTYVSTKTYGVTSLQRQHVTVNGNEVTLSLTGKAAHEITIKTDDPIIVGAIKGALSRNKGKPTDRLFPNTDQTQTAKYIKEVFPDSNNKDMRTYVATALATQMVESMPQPTTPAEFRRQLLDVIETTANQLQHNPQMSKNSYIAPSVFMAWADSAGIDYVLYSRPIKGRNRLIKPLGWDD